MEFGVWPVALGPVSEFRIHSVPVEQKNEPSQVVVVDEPCSSWHIAPLRNHSVPVEQKKDSTQVVMVDEPWPAWHIALAAFEVGKSTGAHCSGCF